MDYTDQSRRYFGTRLYASELGLKTHRPDTYQSNSSSQLETTVSSGYPSFSNNNSSANWWHLPSSLSTDYEQKTKSVRISYSVDEIYSKANVNKPTSPTFENTCSESDADVDSQSQILQSSYSVDSGRWNKAGVKEDPLYPHYQFNKSCSELKQEYPHLFPADPVANNDERKRSERTTKDSKLFQPSTVEEQRSKGNSPTEPLVESLDSFRYFEHPDVIPTHQLADSFNTYVPREGFISSSSEEDLSQAPSKLHQNQENDFSTQKNNMMQVPPIDLSQLSPHKSSRKTKTTHSKSVDFGTQASRSKAIPKPSVTQSVDINKTKAIANEIKRRVQSDPKEIARQVKKHVNLKKEAEKDRQTSEPQPSISEHLNSFRGYDMYIAMTPRIDAGEVSRWSCLPDELWLHILKFLLPKDLHSFMLVCLDFNRLSQDKSLWKKITVNKTQLSDNELMRIGNHQPTKLSITQCTGIKLNGDIVSNYGLKLLFSFCCDSLQKLSIASCVIPPLSGEALLHHAVLHCPKITYLDISWCNLSDRDIELVGDNFPSLTNLLVNGNQSVTDVSMIKLCDAVGHQLVQLEMQGCFKITHGTLLAISKCTGLETLSIGNCHKLSSSQLASSLSKLPKLRVVSLKGMKQIKDSCIISVVKRCPSIQELTLAQCTYLTPRSLTEIACALYELTTLDVSSCKDCVNDASLSCLLSNCRKLISLDISSTSITNMSLENIVRYRSPIIYIKLNFCSLTDQAIQQFISGMQKTLQTVQLYGIKSINTSDLIDNYPNIKILS